MDVRIREADPSVAATLESRLLESLRSTLTQAENTGFVLTASSADDRLIGGLTASTSYGWLLTKVLWVDEASRQQGIGAKLMQSAESKARELDCHSAWLDTSSPAAKQFYEALGYVVFGELANEAGDFPETHTRWFMKKSLRA